MLLDKKHFILWHTKERTRLYPITILSTKKTIKRIRLISHSDFTRNISNIKDKNIFPSTEIVTYNPHLLHHISHTLSKTRIHLMKKFNKAR